MFVQNYMNLMKRMSKDLPETNWIKEHEENSIAEAITNHEDEDIIFKEKLENAQRKMMQADLNLEHKRAIQLKNNMMMMNRQYNGRMSPSAKEELYRYYLNGMTVKDLSLRYGIIPQRVKAIVF